MSKASFRVAFEPGYTDWFKRGEEKKSPGKAKGNVSSSSDSESSLKLKSQSSSEKDDLEFVSEASDVSMSSSLSRRGGFWKLNFFFFFFFFFSPLPLFSNQSNDTKRFLEAKWKHFLGEVLRNNHLLHASLNFPAPIHSRSRSADP